MIDYIYKTDLNQVAIVSRGQLVIQDRALSGMLEELARKRLSTLEGRIKAVKHHFKFKTKCPIYLGEDLLFVPLTSIRSDNALLVNVRALASFRKQGKNEAMLTFSGGGELKIAGYDPFCRMLKKAQIVVSYCETSSL
jgi:hypothetical protein